MIEVKNIHFWYPDGTNALCDVSLEIQEGEFIALIGQNGSGKTTFAKCIAGILKPTKGEILIDGKNLKNFRRKEIAEKIGYVFQNPDHQLFSSTCEKEISSGPRNLKLPLKEIKRRVEIASEIAGVARNLFNKHPFFLSKGLRQRVAIASILSMQPKAIIVDEPTTGQDFKQSISVMEFLKKLNQQKHTILIITHEMHIVAKYAKRVVLFKDGKILEDGLTKEVFEKRDSLAKARVKPPQITIFSRRVLNKTFLTCEEFLVKRKSEVRGQKSEM